MTETKKATEENLSTLAIENPSRRKAVKTIVAGTGALAAYHTLPVNWSTPIIEQIFLPAHAQTSGYVPPANEEPIVCSIDYLGIREGLYYLRVTAKVNPPEAGVLLHARVVENRVDGTVDVFEGTETSNGPIVTDANGIFSTEYDTVETANFASIEFTITVVSSGASTTCTWTGP